jgi:hypothetical protein
VSRILCLPAGGILGTAWEAWEAGSAVVRCQRCTEEEKRNLANHRDL